MPPLFVFGIDSGRMATALQMKKLRTLALTGPIATRTLFGLVWLSLFAYAGRPLLAAAAAGGLGPGFAWTGLVVLAFLSILPAFAGRTDGFPRRSAMHWIGYATLGVFST